jgi:hypothetical protein
MNGFSSIWGWVSFRPPLSRLATKPCSLDGCPMFADFRVHGLKTTFFKCFHYRSTPYVQEEKKEGLPPDFLWSLVALANLMRLSLRKAAHAAVGSATWQEIRVTHLVQPMYAKTRTWGTRPGGKACEEEIELSPKQRMTLASLGSRSRSFITDISCGC